MLLPGKSCFWIHLWKIEKGYGYPLVSCYRNRVYVDGVPAVEGSCDSYLRSNGRILGDLLFLLLYGVFCGGSRRKAGDGHRNYQRRQWNCNVSLHLCRNRTEICNGREKPGLRISRIRSSRAGRLRVRGNSCGERENKERLKNFLPACRRTEMERCRTEEKSPVEQRSVFDFGMLFTDHIPFFLPWGSRAPGL